MREQGRVNLGFYPAAPAAIEALCRHLAPTPGPGAGPAILDPCGGDGVALGRLAAHLGCGPAEVAIRRMRDEDWDDRPDSLSNAER